MITAATMAVLASVALADRPLSTTLAPKVHESPSEAVAAYFEGRDRGSSRTIRTAFHPDAPLQWVGPDGAPQLLEQVEWWSRIEGKANPATHNDQTLLDREGGMAMIESSSRWATHAFLDLLILAHTPEGWLIVGKAFTRIAAGDTLPAPTAEDERGIRGAVKVKIEAHAEYEPALLLASHLPTCRYFRVHVENEAFTHNSLSLGAARYAGMRERGVQDHDSKWRVLDVIQRGDIAGVKLDVVYKGVRYVDYLLLLRGTSGWKIAAAVWGDPAK